MGNGLLTIGTLNGLKSMLMNMFLSFSLSGYPSSASRSKQFFFAFSSIASLHQSFYFFRSKNIRQKKFVLTQFGDCNLNLKTEKF